MDAVSSIVLSFHWGQRKAAWRRSLCCDCMARWSLSSQRPLSCCFDRRLVVRVLGRGKNSSAQASPRALKYTAKLSRTKVDLSFQFSSSFLSRGSVGDNWITLYCECERARRRLRTSVFPSLQHPNYQPPLSFPSVRLKYAKKNYARSVQVIFWNSLKIWAFRNETKSLHSVIKIKVKILNQGKE